MAVVLAKVHLPSLVTNSLDLIGSATSGVALFSAGLVLAAYPVRLAPGVFAGSLARVAVQSANAEGSTSSTLGQKPILTRSPGVLQPSRRTYDRAFCKPIQVRPIRDRVDAFDLNPWVDYYGPSNTLDH